MAVDKYGYRPNDFRDAPLPESTYVIVYDSYHRPFNYRVVDTRVWVVENGFRTYEKAREEVLRLLG